MKVDECTDDDDSDKGTDVNNDGTYENGDDTDDTHSVIYENDLNCQRQPTYVGILSLIPLKVGIFVDHAFFIHGVWVLPVWAIVGQQGSVVGTQVIQQPNTIGRQPITIERPSVVVTNDQWGISVTCNRATRIQYQRRKSISQLIP